MGKQYKYELQPMVHKILFASSNRIHLAVIKDWNRNSIPKSPIVQKLCHLVISAMYPWWNPYLEISYQELGPFSPKIDLVFRDLLAEGICKINGDYLEILPCSINENDHFIEISELFIHKLIVYCNNKILDPFETIELFSIISVEQARLNHSQNVFRPMSTISLENKKLLIIRVKNSMKYTKLLSRFVLNYSPTYVYNFINERIDDFYDALRTSKFFDIYKS